LGFIYRGEGISPGGRKGRGLQQGFPKEGNYPGGFNKTQFKVLGRRELILPPKGSHSFGTPPWFPPKFAGISNPDGEEFGHRRGGFPGKYFERERFGNLPLESFLPKGGVFNIRGGKRGIFGVEIPEF